MDWTNEDARRQALAKLSRDEIRPLVEAVPTAELLEIGRASIAKLGVYELSLVNEERIKGKLRGPERIRAVVREAPKAARLEFVEGPAKGRKVLYNAELRREEMRVREPGLLGVAGGIWLRLDNPLAKADSLHPVTDIGFGPLLGQLAKDLERSTPYGGHARRDLGFDGDGHWVIEFTAPSGVSGLDAERAKLTIDLAVGLPAAIEAFDARGLLERHRYTLVRQNITAPPGFFEPKAFGV
ncbi:MAG: DUF1571 domain-containing protein [Polyangiaceae bacterium]